MSFPASRMADGLTISLLPVPLALVHIPRSRLSALSHPVLRHILHPDPAFFTITANEIEISLFVDYEHVHDFDVIAQKDRRTLRHNPVEISHEPWSVLQIDSHTDQHDNSGARVNELSGPLADAGISILYQSSYMCDFIFVKESRLHEALTLFESAGFVLYTNTPSSPCSSSSQHSNSNRCYSYSTTASSPNTILTLSQSSTTHSPFTPTSCSPTPDKVKPHPNERTKSHSPISGEVRILDPDLACVGLSDEFGIDHWGLKIVKLVAFPELITSSSSPKMRMNKSTILSPSLCSSGFGDEEDDDDDDGYFSHSPHSISASELTLSSSPLSSQQRTRLDSGHNLPPIITNADPFFTSRISSSTSSPVIPSSSSLKSSTTPSHNIPQPISQHSSSSPSTTTSPPLLQVPFFSFTRTQEGSSLTADVRTLAALFLPEERHLLVCCDSLEFEACRTSRCGYGSNIKGGGNEDVLDESDEYLDDEDEDDKAMSIGELKCLQVDLRKFGLDKYGLVNKFSTLLGENGVNHMYSSTFKTANLLVNKKHARRAQALLRGS